MRQRQWYLDGYALAQLSRAPLLGVSALMLLSGLAATAPPRIPWTRIVLGAVVTLPLHVAVYILNDVFDLPLDLTEPRRRGSPLVDGRLSVPSALAFASASGSMGLVALLLVSPASAAYGLAFLILMGTYDAFGKRAPWPVLTDIIQGCGWGALVMSGAVLGGRLNATAVAIAASQLPYIAIVNGVHGGLRDLHNDARHHARTTALWFGARPVGEDRDCVSISRRLVLHALLMQTLRASCLLVSYQVINGERDPTWWLLFVAETLNLVILFGSVAGRAQGGYLNWLAGFAYIFLESMTPLLLIVPAQGTRLPLLLFVAAALPWIASRWVRRALISTRHFGRLI